MAEYLDSEAALDNCVWQAVHSTPAVDLSTGLHGARYPEAVRPWGVDALLTAPELVDALFRCAPRAPDNPGQVITRAAFSALPSNIRADMVWHRLFVARTPLSEDARAVLTSLGLLQLNPDERLLDRHRAAFADLSFDRHWAHILQVANLSAVTTPCDPLSPLAAKAWPENAAPGNAAPAGAQAAGEELPGFQTALDLDSLLDWETARPRLESLGALKKSASGEIDKTAVAALLRFIGGWFARTRSLYLSARWCAGCDLGAKHHAAAKILRKCVLPFCARHGVPLLLALGGRPRRPGENQPASLTLEDVLALGEAFPANRFILAAPGSRELAVLLEAARRLPRVTALGGAAGAPAEFARSLRDGLSLLGDGFIPFHSAATVPEQLPGRWAHARWTLGKVLQEHYRSLRRTGWRLTEKDIRRDVVNLLQENALRLCRRGDA